MTLDYVRSAFILISYAAPALAGQMSTPIPTQVTAVVLPEGRYSPVSLREMGREAAHILTKSGVSLHWHLGEPAQAVNGFLIVVKLVGRCDMDGPPAFLKVGALGWTHQADGVVLPFSDLDCDNIRGAVQSGRMAGHQLRGNVLLGRAMGRVLAHEIYHVMADTAEHGEDGVAQPALSTRDLTSGKLELRASDIEAIQSGLRQTR